MSFPIPEAIEVGATPLDVNITITQGEVPRVGFRLKDQDPNDPLKPLNLRGFGAIMQVRGRVDSAKVLLELKHCAGLVFDLDEGIIWLRPTLQQINALPTANIKREWAYDLILEQPTGGPVILTRGKFTVLPVVTRVDFGNVTNDVPRPPSVFEVIIPGIQGANGIPGELVGSDGFLQVSKRLSELAVDSDAQKEAQANLGLDKFDPLAYYILAKA